MDRDERLRALLNRVFEHWREHLPGADALACAQLFGVMIDLSVSCRVRNAPEPDWSEVTPEQVAILSRWI
jgi:hypothetical protein